MSAIARVARRAAASTLVLVFACHAAVAAPAAGDAEIGRGSATAAEGAPVDRADELECLATAIYHEARGEPARGQLVVGRVILNRVASRYYPDTICEVVYQNVHMRNRCQFSFACDGIPKRVTEKRVWRDIERRAEWLLNCVGENDCEESKRHGEIWTSTHYHADYVHPFWADVLARTGRIGRHIFYYTPTM